ncbi:unnamed protein product [Oppiella nova]|uniref:Uncharacterized protein n=1 Tax=Oppiella nova TaxID=334625 RepID=A0A7R9MEL6_9ACAR|nr:unnamed protein product [Oppiella nova]CAG2175827.1 unnamed protein product [Oppiella nova]
MINTMAKRKLIGSFADSIPDLLRATTHTGAHRDINVNELLKYEVRGLMSERILRNPNNPESYDWTENLLSEAYGRPVRDVNDITAFIDMCYTTVNKKVAFVINYWTIFAFMMDDYMDQIVMDDEGKSEICEWQQKYITGKSGGHLGLDKMLVKTLAISGQYMAPDQYVRHVVSNVRWMGTYLTVNPTKFNVDHQMLTYVQYWTQREMDCMYITVFIFSELSVGLDAIEHRLTTDPIWKAFNVSAGKHSVLVNEVYSVKSEVPKGQGRGQTFKNRIGVSPMTQLMADKQGFVGDWHLMSAGSYASGGAGLVMMEGTGVEPMGRISNRIHNCI